MYQEDCKTPVKYQQVKKNDIVYRSEFVLEKFCLHNLVCTQWNLKTECTLKKKHKIERKNSFVESSGKAVKYTKQGW